MRIRMMAMLCLVVLLSACSADSTASARGAAEKIAPYYETIRGLSARITMNIDRGTQESMFTLDWEATAQQSVVTVVKPDAVAGVAITAGADGREIVYNGAALVLPDAVSPLELLPWMLTQWRGGAYAEVSDSSDAQTRRIAVIYRETIGENAVESRTLFDAARLTPLQAEVFVNGLRRAVMSFDTIDFT